MSLHPDAYAAAWEGIPTKEKHRLLNATGLVPVKFVPACADARWAFLAADVCEALKPLLPPNTVANTSTHLHRKDQP